MRMMVYDGLCIFVKIMVCIFHSSLAACKTASHKACKCDIIVWLFNFT